MTKAPALNLVDEEADGVVSRPDVTAAQQWAAGGYVAALVLAYGAGLRGDDFLAVVVSSAAVACVWKISDAWIRAARNKAN